MYRSESFDEVAANRSSVVNPVDAHDVRTFDPIAPLSRRIKRLIDIAGAVAFFTLGLPLYVAVAIGVRISSPGPVHYWQYRIGRDGRRFRFYKFRSMVVDSEEVLSSLLDSDENAKTEWDTFQKLENDPRITRFGRFIRRASLDELPQFWNVLVGDMSLIGPRPCMEGQEKLYGASWQAYCLLRPGLTGLWQVSGRNRLSYSERVRLDAEYLKCWSLGLDVSILLRTIKTVFTGDGSR